jgi:hypothetical protein
MFEFLFSIYYGVKTTFWREDGPKPTAKAPKQDRRGCTGHLSNKLSGKLKATMSP